MIHVVWGIVIACGKSEQLGSNEIDTAFLNLGGKPILYHSIYALEKCPEIDGIAVVARKERLPEIQQMAQLFGFTKLRKIAAGGTQRAACVKTALSVLPDNVSIVTLQDVSRPMVDMQVVSDTVKTAKRYGCSVAAAKMPGSVKIAKKGLAVDSTLDGVTVWNTQSPFSCKRDLLVSALENVAKKKLAIQDEAHALELMKKEVRVVASSTMNLKIMDAQDLAVSEAMLKLR